MPWHTTTPMLQRHEFVILAGQQGPVFKELCRRFGISRKTGYKWLDRFRRGGAAALAEQPRRPHRSPMQTPSALSEAVIGLRLENPAWGGRKLKRRLEDLGHLDVPSASTCTEILRRADLLAKEVPRGPM